MPTIFSSIIKKEIACEILYEDDICIAIHDIRPIAPIHILIIPKKEIVSMMEIEENDKEIIGHLFYVGNIIAKNLNIETGYRLVINSGIDALQTVMHLHIHLLAGRGFSWPPG